MITRVLQMYHIPTSQSPNAIIKLKKYAGIINDVTYQEGDNQYTG